MEFFGLGLVVALWRYLREVDWDVRIRRKLSRKPKS